MVAHVSFSQLSTYKYCGKQFYLERIAKVPDQVPGWFTVAGSAFHELTAVFDRGGNVTWANFFNNQIELEEHTTGTTRDRWRVAGVTKANREGQTYQWWLAKGEELFGMYIDWVMEMPPATMIEDDISGFLDPDIQLKGMVDRVYPDLIVDIKTGTAQPKTAEAQLGVYRAAMLARDGVAPDKGAYYMAKDGKLTKEYDLSIWTPEYVSKLFREMKAGIAAGVFLPSPSFSCNACPVRDFCYTAKGAKSQGYDPLHPNFGGSDDQGG